jgi:hypothetical protein
VLKGVGTVAGQNYGNYLKDLTMKTSEVERAVHRLYRDPFVGMTQAAGAVTSLKEAVLIAAASNKLTNGICACTVAKKSNFQVFGLLAGLGLVSVVVNLGSNSSNKKQEGRHFLGWLCKDVNQRCLFVRMPFSTSMSRDTVFASCAGS